MGLIDTLTRARTGGIRPMDNSSSNQHSALRYASVVNSVPVTVSPAVTAEADGSAPLSTVKPTSVFGRQAAVRQIVQLATDLPKHLAVESANDCVSPFVTTRARQYLIVLRVLDGQFIIGRTQEPESANELERIKALIEQAGFVVNQVIMVAPELVKAVNNQTVSLSQILEEGQETTGAERALVQLFHSALARVCTDIHIQVTPGDMDWSCIRYRDRANHLSGKTTMGAQEAIEMARNLFAKSISKAGGSEWDITRIFDGKLQVKLKDYPLIEIRWNQVPIVGYGFRLVMRMLGSGGARLDMSSLQSLGYEAKAADRLERWILRPAGVLFVCAATNNGKSTLLGAMLKTRAIARAGTEAIVTIEQPVESKWGYGISQISIDDSSEYNGLIRAQLRQNPNVVVVGETRDADSAIGILNLAMTGVMCATTLHTSHPFQAFQRLINEYKLKPEALLTEGMVVGVVQQLLVPKLCPHCRIPLEDQMHTLLSDQQHRYHAAFPRGFDGIYVANVLGCSKCEAGRVGRMPVCELLELDGVVRDLLRRGQFDAAMLYRRARMGIYGVDSVVADSINDVAHRLMQAGVLSPLDFERSAEIRPLDDPEEAKRQFNLLSDSQQQRGLV